MTNDSSAAGRVGFVSLGCPKATVDSEQIITQLRAEGYQISPDYAEADMVIVNTCGFIDEAVAESLDAIDEALHENGKVIVTGCLGARAELINEKFPQLLAVTGPHARDEVMQAVHTHLPAPHDPFIDLVPKQGIKLTPRHYAYLKISEGCNHRCSFCIIPSMRGDLVSRPIDDVMDEARNPGEAGVRELLVISQDTSAYGVDRKYRYALLARSAVADPHARPVPRARPTRRLGAAALRVPVSACRRRDPADGRGAAPALPRYSVPARQPADSASDEAAGQPRPDA